MLIEDIHNILIIRNDGIGDMINSTPAIKKVRDNYPDACICVLSSELNAEILYCNPDIDKIIIDKKGIIEKIRLIFKLRQLNFDLVLVNRTSSWGNFIAYMSKATYSIGRYQKRFKSKLTHPVRQNYPKGTIHETIRNIELVEPILPQKSSQKDSVDNKQILNLSDSEIKWGKETLYKFGIKESDFLVGIHPGGSSYDKLWQIEKYIEIANRLISNFGYKIILLYGPGEKDLADQFADSVDNSVVFAPDSLRHLASLLNLCNLVICNDSGPMHIASALNRPIVAIFGPTDHIRWMPLGEHVTVVRQDMQCWPCSAHKCRRSFECIKNLSEDRVWQEVIKLL